MARPRRRRRWRPARPRAGRLRAAPRPRLRDHARRLRPRHPPSRRSTAQERGGAACRLPGLGRPARFQCRMRFESRGAMWPGARLGYVVLSDGAVPGLPSVCPSIDALQFRNSGKKVPGSAPPPHAARYCPPTGPYPARSTGAGAAAQRRSSSTSCPSRARTGNRSSRCASPRPGAASRSFGPLFLSEWQSVWERERSASVNE